MAKRLNKKKVTLMVTPEEYIEKESQLLRAKIDKLTKQFDDFKQHVLDEGIQEITYAGYLHMVQGYEAPSHNPRDREAYIAMWDKSERCLLRGVESIIKRDRKLSSSWCRPAEGVTEKEAEAYIKRFNKPPRKRKAPTPKGQYTIGTDVSPTVCKEEGYMQMCYDVEELFNKEGGINPHASVNVFCTYPVYCLEGLGIQYTDNGKCTEEYEDRHGGRVFCEWPKHLDENYSADDLWEIYLEYKKDIDDHSGIEFRRFPENVYDILHLAADIHSVRSLATH